MLFLNEQLKAQKTHTEYVTFFYNYFPKYVLSIYVQILYKIKTCKI